MNTLTTSDPKPNAPMVPQPVEHLRDETDLTLSVRHVVVEHGRKKNRIQAVADVSFDIRQGETLGLVGESGCGKSSLAHALMQLPRPTSGSVLLQDRELVGLSGRELSDARSPLQMILQDPMSSINPMRRIRDVVTEGLAMRGVPAEQRRAAAAAALDEVGLDIDVVGNRRANELSGGQCQRVCIARCLVLEPRVIICDEPVSALDVSVQAQTLNLLQDMKRRHGVSILFIAHDLAVVRNISDRVAVMYLGKICELGPADDVYDRPLHPYSLALLNAIPVPDPTISTRRAVLHGEPPSAMDPPSGCRFSPRCPSADHLCRREEPRLRELEPGHYVACHHPNELTELSLRWPAADPTATEPASEPTVNDPTITDPMITPTTTDPGALAGEGPSSPDEQSPASATDSGEDHDG